MKRFLYYLGLMSILLVTGCVQSTPYRPYDTQFHRTLYSTDKKLENLGYKIVSSGGGAPNTIHLAIRDYSTNTFRFTRVDEARKYIVQFVEEYLKPINDDKKVRQYLLNYPFASKNLMITIYFVDENSQPLKPPYLSSVTCNTGKIFYDQFVEDRNRCVFDESYERAKSIERAQ
jgi:hypothetical protein